MIMLQSCQENGFAPKSSFLGHIFKGCESGPVCSAPWEHSQDNPGLNAAYSRLHASSPGALPSAECCA